MSANFCFNSETMRDFTRKKFNGIQAPFIAGIELTAKCNLRCVHCYTQNAREHMDMSNLEIKNLIDILVERNCLEVYFTGGEVFTRSDFDDIYIYAKKKGLIVTVLSNITMLTQKHIDLFIEYPVALISTTMYGYFEDTYERVTRIKGSYKQFRKAIEMLQKNSIPFEIKYVGMKQNIKDVFKVKEFGKKLGVNMVFGFDIRPTSDGNSKPMDYRIAPEEAFEFDRQDNDRRQFWISVAKKDMERPLKQQGKKYSERYAQGYLYPCKVAMQHVFITSDYKLQGCTKTSYIQYDLKEGDFDAGWEYLNKMLVQKKADKNTKCLNCDKSLYCEHCTANSELTFGNTEEVDSFFCKVASLRKEFSIKEAKKELEEFNPRRERK